MSRSRWSKSVRIGVALTSALEPPAGLGQRELMGHLRTNLAAHGLGIDEQPRRQSAGRAGGAEGESQDAVGLGFAPGHVGT